MTRRCAAVRGPLVLFSGPGRRRRLFSPRRPVRDHAGSFPTPDAGAPPVPVAVMSSIPPACTPARASEVLPPRSTVVGQAGTGGGASAAINTYFTSDLYGLFKSVCGGCHVESNLGNFSVTAATFPRVVTRDVYAVMVSTDRNVFMPPARPAACRCRRASRPTRSCSWHSCSTCGCRRAARGRVHAADPDRQRERRVRHDRRPGRAADQHRELRPEQACSAWRVRRWTSSTRLRGGHVASRHAGPDGPHHAGQRRAGQERRHLLRADVPAVERQREKMRYVRVPARQVDRLRQVDAAVHHPGQHALLQDLPQAGHRRERQPRPTGRSRRASSSRGPTRPSRTARPSKTRSSGRTSGTKTRRRRRLLNDPLRDGKPFADRIFTYITDEQKAAPIIAKNPANLLGAGARRRG